MGSHRQSVPSFWHHSLLFVLSTFTPGHSSQWIPLCWSSYSQKKQSHITENSLYLCFFSHWSFKPHISSPSSSGFCFAIHHHMLRHFFQVSSNVSFFIIFSRKNAREQGMSKCVMYSPAQMCRNSCLLYFV